MTSLERMMAAINGEPLDRYPVMNPYPFWSMQPVILEFLGSIEPRLTHIRGLGLDMLQLESSMKDYRNDIGECRKVLGEGVCILGNTPIREVLELGDRSAWQADAEEQARGIGAEGRFVICAGSPTTHATPPKRLLEWARFMQESLQTGLKQ